MSKLSNKNISSVKSDKPQFTFIFGKKNYLFMGIGLAVIFLGFFLMTGHDANTHPNGEYDPAYWNEDIFSWRRIRLAPFLVILGFVIEIYAILLDPNAKKG